MVSIFCLLAYSFTKLTILLLDVLPAFCSSNCIVFCLTYVSIFIFQITLRRCWVNWTGFVVKASEDRSKKVSAVQNCYGLTTLTMFTRVILHQTTKVIRKAVIHDRIWEPVGGAVVADNKKILSEGNNFCNHTKYSVQRNYIYIIWRYIFASVPQLRNYYQVHNEF